MHTQPKAKAHLHLSSLIFQKGRHNMSTYLGQHFMWMWHRDVLMLWMVIQILERFHSFPPIGNSAESSTENIITYKKLSALAGKWHLSRSHCVFSVVYSCVHIVYSVLCILVFTLCILCWVLLCSHFVFCVGYCLLFRQGSRSCPSSPSLSSR